MNDSHFALLIDAENVSNKYIQLIFDELSKMCVITYKRIYGDWTRSAMTSWKAVLLKHSLTPIQQYSYTSGKNSTDSSLIIDAMDILYTGKVEGFCIVSSDSDFTRLASRLRESGMYVIGMGEKKAPEPFITACNEFKHLDVISSSKEHPEAKNNSHTAVTPIGAVSKALLSIAADISDEDGWSALSEVGNVISKRMPDFDVRNYGVGKLSSLIFSLGLFDVKSVRKNGLRVMYIRKKRNG
ncbi:MAG: NYN domain-containing protein [Clostridia bacterium]|nr:NYN domain-containing protein [Clostridia bacterium]